MTMGGLKNCILAVGLACIAAAANAELQTWTLTDGRTFEAEFVAVFPDQVIFRDADGITVKVPFERFTPESQEQIELTNVPELQIDFIQDQNTVVFPAGITVKMQRPPENRCHYGARVKQVSRGNYNHELTMEIFAIGRERQGKKFILLDRQKTTFKLLQDEDREFEFRSNHQVILTNYYVDESVRGEKYFGYLIHVTDVRGETIALESSHRFLIEHLENLKERYANNFMDDELNRVYPTPAPVFIPW